MVKIEKFCLLGSDNKPLKDDKGRIIYKTVKSWKRWYSKNVSCPFPSKIIGVFKSDKELEIVRGVPAYVRLSYCYQEI